MLPPKLKKAKFSVEGTTVEETKPGEVTVPCTDVTASCENSGGGGDQIFAPSRQNLAEGSSMDHLGSSQMIGAGSLIIP